MATQSIPGAVAVLQLTLHDALLAHLVQQPSGASALVFDPAFAADPQRPTPTLATHPSHPASRELVRRPWLSPHGVHPLLANLLPETGLRPWLITAFGAGTSDSALQLLATLGDTLPGAWRLRLLSPDAIPPGVLDFNARVASAPALPAPMDGMAALTGSQRKLAVDTAGDDWKLARHGGRWLLKLPVADVDGLAQNEYTALTLAQLAGVDVPEFRLVPLAKLPQPQGLGWHSDDVGLAVRRFDRNDDGTRIHSEDFAQALFKTPQQKYDLADAMIAGRLVHGFTAAPQANTLQLARRLLVNVLLGNGDAHLKNWSLIYPDRHHAQLAPAYDLQCRQWQPDDKQQRWHIGGCNNWYALDFSHFEQWGRAVGLPWRALKPVLKDTVERARTLWPAALDESPMLETHKLLLRHHWKNLTKKLQYGL